MTLFYRTKREALVGSIQPMDAVLDIGFYGQSKQPSDKDWPHKIVKDRAKIVYGVDTQVYEPERLEERERYFVQSAEAFTVPRLFDAILAADLIEHLPNPGLFLDCCKKHLLPDGRLIITTPNAFNFYNLVEKVMHDEPRINTDHTCYFNKTTLKQLFQKMGWTITEIGYIQSIGLDTQTNIKRRILRGVYHFLGRFTKKFSETLIVIAKPVK